MKIKVLGRATHLLVVLGIVTATVSSRSPSRASELFFSDTFWDGTMASWTVVDAAGATEGPSDWSVILSGDNYLLLQNSNIYLLPTREGTYAYAGDGTWTDYHFDVDVLPQDNDSIFVMFRYVDDDNYYRFILNEQNGIRRLEKKVSGAFATLAEETAGGYEPGVWQNIHISAIGEKITVRLNYAELFSVSDGSLPHGKIAVGTEGSFGCYFDNVLVSGSDSDPYADAVPAAYIKLGGNSQTEVSLALGRPRGREDDLSIGGPGYWIIFDMGANEEVMDGPGMDLRIVEVGALFGVVDEEHDVFAADSLSGPWAYLGQGMAISEFDLHDAGLSQARYVRIDDLSTKTDATDTPGSDIDALQALNMEGNSLLSPPSGVSIAVVGNDVHVTWAVVPEAVQYRIYASTGSGAAGMAQVNTEPIADLEYVHADAAGEHLFYRVTAIDARGYESAMGGQMPYRLFLPLVTRE